MKVTDLTARIETLEQGQNALLGSIENLTKVMVLIQTRIEQGHTAEQQFAIAEAEHESAQPKVHRVSKKAIAEQDLKESMERDSKSFKKEMATRETRAWLEVLEHTAEIVRVNRRKKVFNEKIKDQQVLGKVDCPDYRVYLRTSEHRPFRLAWVNAGMKLSDAVIALADEIGY